MVNDPATTTHPTLRITALTDEDALFCQYPGRAVQPCVLTLDLRDGELTAQYDPEVSDGARPESVFSGRTLWVPIPVLTATAANRLLNEVAPLAQQILDGAEIQWNGSNHIGRLDDQADAAYAELVGRCDPQNNSWDDADTVSTWPAGDWFGPEGDSAVAARLGITADTSDAQIADLAKTEAAEALTSSSAGRAHLTGAEEYLRQVRDELAAGQEDQA